MPPRIRMFYAFCLLLAFVTGTFRGVSVAGSENESALSLEAFTFVRDVADIRLDGYNITYGCRGPVDSFLYPGHTEALIDLVLIHAGGQFEVEVEFIDGHVVSYRLTSENGAPTSSTDQPPNVLDIAKGTLTRYQPISTGTPCLELMSMVDQIMNRDEGRTVETDLATLSFEPNASLGRCATFVWSCRNALRKSVSVGVNKQGFLEWFRDTWRLYTISDSGVIVSEKTAVRIAYQRVTEYICRLGATVRRANVTFEYINSYPNSRGNDCFVLYPTWTVDYTFDKVYMSDADEQCITGYLVGVWADTGEVRTAMPQGFYGSLPSTSTEEGPTPAQVGLVVVLVIVVFGALLLTVRSRRKNRVKRKHE